MKLPDFLTKIKETPEEVSFSDTMETIDAFYAFVPQAFKNGDTYNEAGQNNGSCKIFAFAQLHELSKEETLACFGTYYRNDVLKNPEGDDHQNIRNFIKYGWEGIVFEGKAISMK